MFLRAISHRSTNPSSNLQGEERSQQGVQGAEETSNQHSRDVRHSHKVCDAMQSSLCRCTAVEQSKALCLQSAAEE